MAGLAVLAMVLGSVALAGPAAAANGTQQIQAKALTSHSCDNTEWHFVINQIAKKATAPASITVTWANVDHPETVALDKRSGGVAHYTTTANLTSTVTSAKAEIYKGWSGQFNLSHGPCGTTTPPPADVCKAGTVKVHGTCVVVPPKDLCTNIEGIQETVPAGKIRVEGKCVPTPPMDVCTEKPGTQTNPADCAITPPPSDVCPDKNGMQTDAADCETTTPPTDVCPDKDGMQTDAADCAVTTPQTPSQEVAVLGTKIAAPAVAAPAAANETRVLGTKLASTGAEASLAALAAMVLIVGGTAMVMSVRRRRAKDA